MRAHLHQTTTRKYRSTAKSEVEHYEDDNKPTYDYSVIFRELFCTAAVNLAEQLHQPLENMGVLFDEIFNTGEITNTKFGARSESNLPTDEERNARTTHHSGKGQLLVLIRCIEKGETERLAASGYRFAEIQTVAPVLSRSMKINCDDLPGRLADMYEYSTNTPIISPGVHLALFAIKASVRGGFDILVPKNRRNQLPSIQLRHDGLRGWEADYLSQLDGMSVLACLKFLTGKSKTASTSKEQIFGLEFRDTLRALNDAVDDPVFSDALLVAQPLSVPCRGPNPDAPPGKATIFAFRVIVPIQYRVRGQKLEFVPLSFFRTQQYVYRNSPDHSHFARKVHREFAPILSRKMGMASEGRRMSIRSSMAPRDSGDGFKRLGSEYGDGALDIEMPRIPERVQRRHLSRRFWSRHDDREWEQEPATPERFSSDSGSEAILVEAQTFGGIMVSQEVSVSVGERDEEIQSGEEEETRSRTDGRRETVMPLAQLGTRVGAMKEQDEPETYVDRLIAVCVKARG
jgi:hypothetical protein